MPNPIPTGGMMNATFSLGRIAGIKVGVNWSALVIAWLVAWGLAENVLPSIDEGQSDGIYWAAGTTVAVLFFGSLLAHELAHSVVARRNDVQVEGITLWMFGGVSSLRSEPDTPGAELRVAIVGPLVSLVTGIGFGALGVLLSVLNAPQLIVASCLWLGMINIFLAIFNLLPAAPLDGGRVLAAILWHRSHDRDRATATAARAGVITGFVLIAIAAVEFLVYPGIGALWLAIIGLFLAATASMEQRQREALSLFAGVHVADVMSRDPVLIPGWLTLDVALERYVEPHWHSAFPVHDFSGEITGLLLLPQIMRITTNKRATTRVDGVALPRSAVATARPDDSVVSLLQELGTRQHAVVFADHTVVGIVTRKDLERAASLLRLGRRPRSSEPVS